MDTRTHEQPEEATLEIEMPDGMDATYTHITSYLTQLQGNIDDETKPFVFTKLLSFINAKDASVWREVYDMDSVGGELCAAVSVFWVTRKYNKKAWLGCAVMPPTSWVAVPKVEKDEQDPLLSIWHAVAFGVIAKEGGGKALVLYDTDVKEFLDEEPQRVRDVLRHGALSQLYKKVTENRRNVEVWINKSKPSESGKNCCVRIAMQKLKRWVAHGDKTFAGRGDPRVAGEYYRLTAP